MPQPTHVLLRDAIQMTRRAQRIDKAKALQLWNALNDGCVAANAGAIEQRGKLRTLKGPAHGDAIAAAREWAFDATCLAAARDHLFRIIVEETDYEGR